mmetsp:Transcript_24520/g.34588  ORF Transcript_24520/g.34588 Transcript_24520/m.34588 type:complete len:90 (+) Transcript_24520:1020-1289(+)
MIVHTHLKKSAMPSFLTVMDEKSYIRPKHHNFVHFSEQGYLKKVLVLNFSWICCLLKSVGIVVLVALANSGGCLLLVLSSQWRVRESNI